jgi:hypothetical protein
MMNQPTSAPRFDTLVDIADRLGKETSGSLEMDRVIHAALGLVGPPLLYSREATAARRLFPPDFQEQPPTSAAGQTYACCQRVGLRNGLPYPHHGQCAATYPLALCGAAIRAHATLVEDAG